MIVEDHASLDILSDHSGPLGLLIGQMSGVPTLHTAHGTMEEGQAELYSRLSAAAPSVRLASLTLAQRRPAPTLPWVANLPNAVDLDAHAFTEDAERRHVAWLGRMCHEKGPDRAIVAARAARLPIVLAGKMREPAEEAYFAEHVEPLLGDDVVYVGEVDQRGRNELLAAALVLVSPLDWEEPFGLAMIEAMASGVPVVATRRGSVPEVVDDGLTGIIVDADEELPDAIHRAIQLDRRACRATVETRFSPAALVRRYERAFGSIGTAAQPRHGFLQPARLSVSPSTVSDVAH
jgi:glycosyltransferase involved in cell wall biosynthesis